MEALRIPLIGLVKSCVHSVPVCNELIGQAMVMCFTSGAGDGLRMEKGCPRKKSE